MNRLQFLKTFSGLLTGTLSALKPGKGTPDPSLGAHIKNVEENSKVSDNYLIESKTKKTERGEWITEKIYHIPPRRIPGDIF